MIIVILRLINKTIEGIMSNEALGIFHNTIIPQFVARRKELSISQLEMDEIVGVAKGLVSKWECGIRKPSGYLFCVWADALGMQINLTQKVRNDN
jgi:transcriptional regulator with XRE-family HTH domain